MDTTEFDHRQWLGRCAVRRAAGLQTARQFAQGFDRKSLDGHQRPPRQPCKLRKKGGTLQSVARRHRNCQVCFCCSSGVLADEGLRLRVVGQKEVPSYWSRSLQGTLANIVRHERTFATSQATCNRFPRAFLGSLSRRAL